MIGPELLACTGLLLPRKRWKELGPRVYFIDCNSKYVKIGWSSDVMRRLQQLRVACPYPLEFSAVLLGGPELEAKLHTAMARYRTTNEWFLRRGQLRSFMKSGYVKSHYHDPLAYRPPLTPLRLLEAAE